MRCAQCGSMNNENDHFCRTCGAKIMQNIGMPQNTGTFQNMETPQYTNTSQMQRMPYSANTSQTQGVPYGVNTLQMQKMPMKKQGNILGVISMICGIAALVFFWVIIPGWICGTAAVILGIIQCVSRRTKGMGITGIVTGGLAFIAATIFFIYALLSEDTTFDDVSGAEIFKEPYEILVTYQSVKTDVGTFELVDGWSEDTISTQSSDGYVYAPNGAVSDELSDYIYVGGVGTDLTFDGRNELIQMNKVSIISDYPDISEDDIKVTTELNNEAPIVAFDYTGYSTYYEDNVHVVEKYLMYDGALVAVISYNFDTWDDDILSPEEILDHIVDTFKVTRGQ